MSCRSCSSKCGSDGTPRGCKSNGHCASGGCSKLEVFDWLAGMEMSVYSNPFRFVEVRFKNTRKEFYKYKTDLSLSVGDIVTCEASYGFDVGVVSAAGELVRLQMNRKKVSPSSKDVKSIKHKSTQEEIDKWQEAQKLEKTTMLKARLVTQELKLDMKIGDVEYQGDGTKAIFYYIADDRVDFRELIKVLAGSFKIRVEMKQIGARQEAGRIGGIGSCGRELCCSTWLTDFRTVSTAAARYQQLAINPLKLAGQCGKLKCCLNYELDSYLEAVKDFPNQGIKLKTQKGIAVHQKTDIFKDMMWYAYETELGTFIPMKIDDVKYIIEQNKKGNKPQELRRFEEVELVDTLEIVTDIVGQDSLTRFDKPKRKKKSRPAKSKKPSDVQTTANKRKKFFRKNKK